MKRKTRHRQYFFCTACRLKFCVFHERSYKRNIFCPTCGDSADVEEYKAEKHSIAKPWTVAEERELLEDVKAGKRPSELTAKYGRETKHIRDKANRMGIRFRKKTGRPGNEISSKN